MLFLIVAAAISLDAGAQAEKKKPADKPSPVAEDIMDHRTMAEAHRKAAECLEAGKPEKDCHAQLQKDCKGVGIGKNCGMKHKHTH
jgi:hypothetical protein